ncbi:MAG: hypothetical protein M1834_003022 [Cirrosporium novae-zelandiae]|nr:MAG: hypothetical protein M1834_003022 [Cirrosporium novae-zelandiae]
MELFKSYRAPKDSKVTIGGTAYPTDEWTNVPSSIIGLADRKPRLYLDSNHPICITRKLIEGQFGAPEYKNHQIPNPVVSVHDNFDVLGFPPDHVGRSRTDTYYVNKDTVLRTHTSAHQAQHFREMDSDGYTLSADVYRRDAIDRSHYPVFHQMEGARLWDRNSVPQGKLAEAIWKDVEALPKHDIKVEDPNPTFHPERNPLQSEFHSPEEAEAVAAHLKRSLEGLIVQVMSKARQASIEAGDQASSDSQPLQVRWIEAYFPFTSPSWEIEVFWQGDWLELLGCGIVKQDLLNNSSCTSKIGWAWGIGLERIAMLLFGIPDIRLFWSQDPRFLSQFHHSRINHFRPFSKYPACPKDVAFWVKHPAKGFHENDVMEIVRDVGGDLIEDVKLVDEFTHPKTGRRSLCYRIVYRSLERTLTNMEINELHERVREKLEGEMDVELR